MPAYRCLIQDTANNAILAAVEYVTSPRDSAGNVVQDAASNIAAWRATWCPADSSGTHTPVYSNAGTKDLDFPSELDAYKACRQAIDAHYSGSLQVNVRLVQ